MSAILDFCYGPKTWIPDACERRDFSASNPPGLNHEAPRSSSLHCALYYRGLENLRSDLPRLELHADHDAVRIINNRKTAVKSELI